MKERLHPRDIKDRIFHNYKEIPQVIQKIAERQEVTDLLPHTMKNVKNLFIKLDTDKVFIIYYRMDILQKMK